MYAKKNSGKKVVATLLAIILLVGCVVGGTLAWLVDKTDPIENVFTTSDVNITLTESENLNLQMVPGKDITKDPKITVLANSEACWLFVKIDETEATDNQITNGTADATTYITYAVADGWTLVEGQTNVYYRKVNTSTGNQEFPVLKDNKVAVPNTVTKTMMEAVDGKNADGSANASETAPKLTFTAYAIQQEGFNSSENTEAQNAAAAWAEASKS